MRSKLSVLPEEQGTLTRNRAKDNRQRASSHALEMSTGPQSLSSDVNTMSVDVNNSSTDVNSNVRRKRSQSLADIQVNIQSTLCKVVLIQLCLCVDQSECFLYFVLFNYHDIECY